ncbi:hypothetical protein LEN26_014355 [Aphanomyces euteiches]|nr:hypothetical protein LEN26_014355 [Aphanomyces euteiches]KAH9115187.1 hypothetical protein AeMF1_010770 [Aphanomyces euteiches]KAH9191633.1 hypothetical protein AeNC1_006395 [Aphanomyces euteiches]
MGNNIAKLAQEGYWDEIKEKLMSHLFDDVNTTAGVLEWTALCFAAWKGKLEIASILVQYPGIEINKSNIDGMTPLHEAAKHNHLDIAILLMNAGANPHAMNAEGLKPLDLATENDMSYFLGMCMLPVAVCAERLEWYEVKRRIRARQISDINATFGEQRWTLLSFATLHNQVEVVTHLIRYKSINVNRPNKDGSTPLHEAARLDNLEILKLLLTAGADKTIRNEAGQLPFDLASPPGQELLVESTLEGFNAEGLPRDVIACSHCTYINPNVLAVCSMCGLELKPVNKTSNVEELLERIHALEEAKLCAICEEHVKDTVFGCGHETCAICAPKLTECPVCRQEITTRIRRYV